MRKIQITSNLAGATTIGDAFAWVAREFKKAKLYFGHGTANAQDEAWFLMLHVLKMSPQEASAIGDAVFVRSASAEIKDQVANLVQARIATRKPMAYLLHEAYFAGLKFYVDARVLIPRSPLAELIIDQFAPWVSGANESATRILDIGTGSGCIAIACAHYLPGSVVDAVDISADALAVAKRNVAKHNLNERVQLYKSDLFAKLVGKKYDIIIANPPYVSSGEMRTLPQEYYHEPRQALEAGGDGLDIVERILHDAKQHLTPRGVLIVEVGNSALALMAKYPRVPFTWLEFACGEAEVLLLDAADL